MRPDAAPIVPGDLRRRLAVLWLIVFVDLLGFGVLIPLIPFYAVRLGLSAEWVTPVIALHSLMQFVGAPLLGRLSDRYGRRPVLALSMAGHVAAYVLLAFSDSLAWLIASRLLSGFTSGNLSAAYAYVSDVTPVERRATSLARISAAFALGFAIGPALGGWLAGAADPVSANLASPALMAAALSTLALVGILAFLPESHVGTRRSANAAMAREKPSARIAALRDPALRLMVILCLCVLTFAAMRESLMSLWLHDRLAYDTHAIGMVFTINGFTVAFAQFVLVGPLARQFGEMVTLRAGVVCYGISWAGLLLAHDLPSVLSATAIGAFGTALFGTSLQTLVSLRAAPTTRGAIMGMYQSSSSLARFSGAASSGTLYGQLGRDVPFLFGAVAMLPALLITLRIGSVLRQEAKA
jgi:DHA1 family tetracycline resistance protein-like MFS transporter